MDALIRSEALITAMANANSIALTGHTKPDGDCVGAVMGLALALSNAGKDVHVLLEPYQQRFNIIPGKELLADIQTLADQEFDLFIAVDCAEEKRLGIIQPYFKKAKQTMNIDHHISNTNYADINCVIADASSASEIVFHVISSDFMVNKDIASALYAGIMYDTGGLRYPNTKPETLHVVSQLLSFGIDFTEIIEQMLYSHSIAKSKLLARVIEKMRLTPCKKVIYSWITKQDFEETGSSSMETDGLVGYLLSTDGVSVALFFSEDDNGVKVSYRSNGTVDVCQIAQKFNGGGHTNASACVINEDMGKAMEQVLDEIYTVMVGSK